MRLERSNDPFVPYKRPVCTLLSPRLERPNSFRSFFKNKIYNFQLSIKIRIFAPKENNMGVTFDDTEKKFVFDFEHDGAEELKIIIISYQEVQWASFLHYYIGLRPQPTKQLSY